jgi:hypothetical protein
MAITPANTGISFAPRTGARTSSKTDQPKAQFWMNVGYYAGEGDDRRFVSLPVGIPLDTQEPLKVSGQNQSYNDFNGARNELLKALVEAAGGLPPGGEDLVNLQIQLRRVNDEVQVATGEANAYSLTSVAQQGFSLLSSKANAE